MSTTVTGIARTPEPPYYAVIFTSKRAADDGDACIDHGADGDERAVLCIEEVRSLPMRDDEPGSASDTSTLTSTWEVKGSIDTRRGPPRGLLPPSSRSAFDRELCGDVLTQKSPQWVGPLG